MEMSCSYCGRYAKHRASTLDCIELKGRTKFENSNKHKLPKLVEFFSESEDKWEPHPVIWLMDTDTSFCTVWVTKENVLNSGGNPDWDLLSKAKKAGLLTSSIED